MDPAIEALLGALRLLADRLLADSLEPAPPGMRDAKSLLSGQLLWATRRLMSTDTFPLPEPSDLEVFDRMLRDRLKVLISQAKYLFDGDLVIGCWAQGPTFLTAIVDLRQCAICGFVGEGGIGHWAAPFEHGQHVCRGSCWRTVVERELALAALAL